MTKTSTKTSFELFIKWCEKHNKPTNKPETLAEFLNTQTYTCEGCGEKHFKEDGTRFVSASGEELCEECGEIAYMEAPNSMTHNEYYLINDFGEAWKLVYTKDFEDKDI